MTEQKEFKVRSMAEMTAAGEAPEVLFWVGCAGSFDDRAKKITKAFAKIMHHVDISFAILGKEESCTGDPAKRAGNEFLFQMQAMNNIAIMNEYKIKKIVTTCPHCFNTLKNEYPSSPLNLTLELPSRNGTFTPILFSKAFVVIESEVNVSLSKILPK